jgi:MFS family permease
VLPSPLVAVPVAATLLLAPAANAALFAAMLRATPDNMRGRVSNTVTQAAVGLAALAPLTAGLLVQHFSGRWALAAFAAALGAGAILCTVLPGFRDAGSPQRAADPFQADQ